MAIMGKYLKIDDIQAYKIATKLSDHTWQIISKWDWFNKNTLGVQFIRAIDSIAANIAEGFGRYHKKDKIKFYYNSRGSVFESAYWCKRAYFRKLITKKEKEYIMSELRKLPKEINSFIKYTNIKLTI